MPQTEILDLSFILHPTELFHLSLPSPNFADKIGHAQVDLNPSRYFDLMKTSALKVKS